jgi:thimet oligopeptidase
MTFSSTRFTASAALAVALFGIGGFPIAFSAPASAKAPMAPVTLPSLTAAGIKAMCDKDLTRARKTFLNIARGKGEANVLHAMNRLNMLMEDLSGPLYIINNVSPDKATRDAAEECTLKWAPFETDIFQNEGLYKRIKVALAADAIDAQYKKVLIESFEDNGVALPLAKRKRVKDINEQITKLGQEFDKNVREYDVKLPFTAAQLQGVPEDVLKNAKVDAEGRYLIGMDYPSYLPVLENAVDESVREKMHRAKSVEGGDVNLELLDKISVLRQELAGIYGYPSYAAFTLRRKMAGTPDAVIGFLNQVKEKVTQIEQREVDELRALKAKSTNQPLAATKLNRWDTAYYQKQAKREQFNVNQEEIRRYFPTEASVSYMLRLSEKLYGVLFRPRDVKSWHPDVRVFDVADSATTSYIGTVYLDLFPRDGKYNHAAVWGIRNASGLTGRTPLPVLVTNLNRQGLTQDELETLLHEFGHALHGLMSTARYNALAGTNVLRDYVEAPSQMFEEWARREEPLNFFAQVCGNCPKLSTEQITALDRARKYGQGLRYARQHLYASYDIALTHDRKNESAMQTWKRLEAATPLGHVEGSKFPASFGHVAGGYAAGYYGYMWSEVMALDMLSAYGNNLLDPRVGRRYRDTILAQGGQIPAEQLIQQFLGRSPTPEAFFKEITGQR